MAAPSKWSPQWAESDDEGIQTLNAYMSRKVLSISEAMRKDLTRMSTGTENSKQDKVLYKRTGKSYLEKLSESQTGIEEVPIKKKKANVESLNLIYAAKEIYNKGPKLLDESSDEDELQTSFTKALPSPSNRTDKNQENKTSGSPRKNKESDESESDPYNSTLRRRNASEEQLRYENQTLKMELQQLNERLSVYKTADTMIDDFPLLKREMRKLKKEVRDLRLEIRQILLDCYNSSGSRRERQFPMKNKEKTVNNDVVFPRSSENTCLEPGQYNRDQTLSSKTLTPDIETARNKTSTDSLDGMDFQMNNVLDAPTEISSLFVHVDEVESSGEVALQDKPCVSSVPEKNAVPIITVEPCSYKALEKTAKKSQKAKKDVLRSEPVLDLKAVYKFGSATLTGWELKQCRHSGKVSSLANDLFTKLFSKEDMALCNLTGKTQGAYLKKRLDESRINSIIGYVCNFLKQELSQKEAEEQVKKAISIKVNNFLKSDEAKAVLKRSGIPATAELMKAQHKAPKHGTLVLNVGNNDQQNS